MTPSWRVRQVREEPARKLVKWNEFEGKYFSIRVGGGFLYEFAAFAQDDDSKEQFALEPQTKFRDGRVLLKGKLKFIKRPVTWSMGIMYDAPNDQWVARQTGLMIDVPEISGQIFIGRTKEGFSLNKVMVGYAGWTAERATINDATIPILADGIKWLAILPSDISSGTWGSTGTGCLNRKGSLHMITRLWGDSHGFR